MENQWTKHHVVLLSVHNPENKVGLISKCIKDLSPIRDENKDLGKYTINTNPSGLIEEFYQLFHLLIIKEVRSGYPIQAGDMLITFTQPESHNAILKPNALEIDNAFIYTIMYPYIIKEDIAYIVVAGTLPNLLTPPKGFIKKFIEKQGIYEIMVKESLQKISGFKPDMGAPLTRWYPIIDYHNNITVRLVKSLWIKEITI